MDGMIDVVGSIAEKTTGDGVVSCLQWFKDAGEEKEDYQR